MLFLVLGNFHSELSCLLYRRPGCARLAKVHSVLRVSFGYLILVSGLKGDGVVCAIGRYVVRFSVLFAYEQTPIRRGESEVMWWLFAVLGRRHNFKGRVLLLTGGRLVGACGNTMVNPL